MEQFPAIPGISEVQAWGHMRGAPPIILGTLPPGVSTHDSAPTEEARRGGGLGVGGQFSRVPDWTSTESAGTQSAQTVRVSE